MIEKSNNPRLAAPNAQDVASNGKNVAVVQRRLEAVGSEELKAIILGKFPRDREWEITCPYGDPEACSFAQELRTFMSNNGFRLTHRGIVRAIFEMGTEDLSIEQADGRYKLLVGPNVAVL